MADIAHDVTGRTAWPIAVHAPTVAVALLVSVVAAHMPAVAEPSRPVLADVGPWPVLSRPIAFSGRVWFINSVKGRNHNSADLCSFDPATGTVRYERHLFRQDGRPACKSPTMAASAGPRFTTTRPRSGG